MSEGTLETLSLVRKDRRVLEPGAAGEGKGRGPIVAGADGIWPVFAKLIELRSGPCSRPGRIMGRSPVVPVEGPEAPREDLDGRLVIMKRQADLLEVVDALGPSGGLAGGLDGGQEQCDEHGDDGDDDQKLDQGKTAGAFVDSSARLPSPMPAIGRPEARTTESHRRKPIGIRESITSLGDWATRRPVRSARARRRADLVVGNPGSSLVDHADTCRNPQGSRKGSGGLQGLAPTTRP